MEKKISGKKNLEGCTDDQLKFNDHSNYFTRQYLSDLKGRKSTDHLFIKFIKDKRKK